MSNSTKSSYAVGFRIFFDKKYIWLTNHKGNLELHGVHRGLPENNKPDE